MVIIVLLLGMLFIAYDNSSKDFYKTNSNPRFAVDEISFGWGQNKYILYDKLSQKYLTFKFINEITLPESLNQAQCLNYSEKTKTLKCSKLKTYLNDGKQKYNIEFFYSSVLKEDVNNIKDTSLIHSQIFDFNYLNVKYNLMFKKVTTTGSESAYISCLESNLCIKITAFDTIQNLDDIEWGLLARALVDINVSEASTYEVQDFAGRMFTLETISDLTKSEIKFGNKTISLPAGYASSSSEKYVSDNQSSCGDINTSFSQECEIAHVEKKTNKLKQVVLSTPSQYNFLANDRACFKTVPTTLSFGSENVSMSFYYSNDDEIIYNAENLHTGNNPYNCEKVRTDDENLVKFIGCRTDGICAYGANMSSDEIKDFLSNLLVR